MTSREIKDLSPKLQVLWNKLNDKVRRDIELRKRDISILLTCTQRGDGKAKISRTPSEAFEIITLLHGRVTELIPAIVQHAEEVGLKYDGTSFSTTE